MDYMRSRMSWLEEELRRRTDDRDAARREAARLREAIEQHWKFARREHHDQELYRAAGLGGEGK